MRFLIFLIFFLHFFSIVSQENYVAWAVTKKGFTTDEKSKTTKDGNTIIIGKFHGTVDFDPGLGTYLLTSSEDYEVFGTYFIQKIDKNGKFVYAKKIWQTALNNEIFVPDFEIDEFGNIFIIGSFEGTIDFDPSPEVQNVSSTVYNDIYLAKLSFEGDLIWVKTIEGKLFESSHFIKIDKENNLFITGEFSWQTDFDPSESQYLLTGDTYHHNFLLKLNNNGEFIWVKKINGCGFLSFLDIDANNFLYVSSSFYYDLVSQNSDTLKSKGFHDIFIQKFDPNGTLIWSRSFGGIGFDVIKGHKIDKSNNLYVIGEIYNPIDISTDTNINVFLYSNGGKDYFISKYDSDGNLINGFSFGGIYDDEINSIIIDSSNNILLLGNFNQKVDFDNSENEYNLVAKDNNIFLQKLNSNFDFISTISFGGIGYQDGAIINKDSINNFYILGRSGSSISLFCESGTITLPESDSYFLLKLGSNYYDLGYKSEFDILFYPNPSKGEFFIKQKNKSETAKLNSEILIEVFDMNGKFILNSTSSDYITPIDLSKYIFGEYYISVKYGDNRKYNFKLLKL